MKDGTLAAAIWIVAPVCGFLPVRAARLLILYVPKPTNATSPPLASSFVTEPIKLSNALPAEALEMSAPSAIFCISSPLFLDYFYP